LTSKTLATKAAHLALTKKAFDVAIFDLRKLTSITDFFVLCSADSDTQVKAVTDAIEEGLDRAGEKLWHSEGYREANWVLLDYVDVVVHIFHKNARSFYNLEKLWGDAKIQYIEDRASVQKAPTGSRLSKKNKK
jgi:ribosome-associated protein